MHLFQGRLKILTVKLWTFYSTVALSTNTERNMQSVVLVYRMLYPYIQKLMKEEIKASGRGEHIGAVPPTHDSHYQQWAAIKVMRYIVL